MMRERQNVPTSGPFERAGHETRVLARLEGWPGPVVRFNDGGTLAVPMLTMNPPVTNRPLQRRIELGEPVTHHHPGGLGQILWDIQSVRVKLAPVPTLR